MCIYRQVYGYICICKYLHTNIHLHIYIDMYSNTYVSILFLNPRERWAQIGNDTRFVGGGVFPVCFF